MNTYAGGLVSGFAEKLSFEINLLSFVEFFLVFISDSLNKVGGKLSVLGKFLSFAKKSAQFSNFSSFFLSFRKMFKKWYPSKWPGQIFMKELQFDTKIAMLLLFQGSSDAGRDIRRVRPQLHRPDGGRRQRRDGVHGDGRERVRHRPGDLPRVALRPPARLPHRHLRRLQVPRLQHHQVQVQHQGVLRPVPAAELRRPGRLRKEEEERVGARDRGTGVHRPAQGGDPGPVQRHPHPREGAGETDGH